MFFISGAISKAIATLITYPVQVVRTNIMVNAGKDGVREIIERIYKSNGIAGFFKG